jgi:site-specific DNA-cytosine methylase
VSCRVARLVEYSEFCKDQSVARLNLCAMERIATSSDEASTSPDVAASAARAGKQVARGRGGGSSRGRDTSGRARGRGARGRSSKAAGQHPPISSLRAHSPVQRIATSPEETSDDSSAEVSPESARIQAARAFRYVRGGKKIAQRGRGRGRSLAGPASSSEDDAGLPSLEETLPKSSGLHDYVSWAVNTVLTEAERHALNSISPVHIGSMCTGMATDDMAGRAIEAAMLEGGKGAFKMHSVFKAESDAQKISFLQRHSSKDTYIFDSNAALQYEQVQTVTGELVPRPSCKILAAGIVCIDISGLTTTPKAVSGGGQSGLALRGLLDSLKSMAFDQRPQLIILECVPRLAHHRTVDLDARSGAQFILDELSKLGYIGEWRTVRPRNFYLPQSRDRTYSLNLKRSDMSDAGAEVRRKDLEKAWQLLLRMQVSKAEPLELLLSRMTSKDIILRKRRGHAIESARKAGQKWPQQHSDFAESAGLSEEDRWPPADFVDEVSPLVNPRALDALWMKMALLQKRKQIDWRQSLLIAPAGFGVSWGSIRTCFPCVTPSMEYVILEAGKARLASGFVVLAMQGIQRKEISAFGLATEDDKLLRDLAGNAFTANIIAAFLLAGMLVM